MTELKRRNTQTIVKHIILEEYTEKWGYIITNGLGPQYQKIVAQGKPFTARFAYIDPFAYRGRYANESASDSPVWGSPIIGIQSLDKVKQSMGRLHGFYPDIYSILVEKEKSEFDALLDNLRDAGYGSRIRVTDDLNSLRDGDIAVIHGVFQDHAQKILDFTAQEYLWALYFLDPYGTAGIPLELVQSITSQPRHDVIINFAYLDLQRGRHPVYSDALYGGDIWRQVVEIDDPIEREAAFVELYKDLLEDNDAELAIKQIPLLFPDKERSIFYLILTTHDPTGALAMNEILEGAKLQEYKLRVQWRNEKYRNRTGSVQLSLFDAGLEDPKKPQIMRVSPEEIAQDIYGRCQGRTLLYRQVLRLLINEPYHPEDVKKAMSLLKRQGKVSYGTLRNSEPVAFSSS